MSYLNTLTNIINKLLSISFSFPNKYYFPLSSISETSSYYKLNNFLNRNNIETTEVSKKALAFFLQQVEIEQTFEIEEITFLLQLDYTNLGFNSKTINSQEAIKVLEFDYTNPSYDTGETIINKVSSSPTYFNNNYSNLNHFINYLISKT